jgi:hypothetical protein
MKSNSIKPAPVAGSPPQAESDSGGFTPRPPQADLTPPQADPPGTPPADQHAVSQANPATARHPPRPHPPHPLRPSPTLHTLPPRFPSPRPRRKYCSSCTYPTGNPRVNGILLIMRSKPNFQTPRLSVTLAMIRTYNENCPKKHKKSKPNPNPIQTPSNPNANPIQTLSKPNQTQFLAIRNLQDLGNYLWSCCRYQFYLLYMAPQELFCDYQ